LATGFIGLVLASLGSAFFRTQVVENADYALRAEDNRLRFVPIPAPRGAVYDRNGRLIAETVTTYDLHIDPLAVDSTRRLLERLQEPLALDDSAVAALVARRRSAEGQPLVVAAGLGFREASWIEEHRSDLHAVRLHPRPLRRYSHGEAVAHLIGYVGEISAGELSDSAAWTGYRAGQEVGKAGIERQYESLLGGTPGARYVEVDARGRIIGSLAENEVEQPVPGLDIRLTLDLELQTFAHSIFPQGMNGAIVAMVPGTGEILALYSHPTFDPNLLIGGVAADLWRDLNSDPRRPLLNRATSGIYPPGSTWKLATALIGLEKGVITPETEMPIPCTGGMSYAGRYSRCWKQEGHGALDLAGAIQHSCNVYFYQLGIWLGLNRLATEGTRLGFARRTGVDLPSEAPGVFPADADSYRQRFGWTPTPSEVMSLAIGQGPNSQTPLRMAQFFSALAGDGTSRAPRLLAADRGSAEAETDLRLDPASLQAVRTGLARVTEAGGTAYLSSLERWKLYGKTGTSENAQDPGRPHAWFTGFAGPRDGPPEIVVAAIVEFGEHGSSAAAPLAAKVADFYLNAKHGFATEVGRQTLGERMR
jgi:penicillin-binding protein 2